MNISPHSVFNQNILTSMCSNSVASTTSKPPSGSGEPKPLLISTEPPVFWAINFGSLTFLRSGELRVGVGELTEVEGCIQLSNILDSRLCETELRQSEVAVKNPDDVGAESRFAESAFCLAVPSPSDSSSSDSSKLARRLTVSSDGVKDEEDMLRDFVRRNHSSGIQIRNDLDALAEKGFSQNGCSTR
jgi:hypothetical protein